MSKYLFIKHSKTYLKPFLFSSYNVEKLIAFYLQETKIHADVIFVYKLDERMNSFKPEGHISKGKFSRCYSDMFNFEAYINAELV